MIFRPALFLPLLLLLALGASAAYTDARLPTPDEGAMLTAAAKILRGAVFYRDLDAYPFPGSHYLLALGFRVFGEHLSVARWMAALLYCISVASLYGAALQVMDRRFAALFGLSLLCFKFLAWPAFSIFIYSDVAFAAACVGVFLLLGHRHQGPSLRLLLAGVAIGAATASKQSTGLYLAAAAAAALLLPRLLTGADGGPLRRRMMELGVLSAGGVASFVPMLAYFAYHQVLGTMLYSGLIRPFTHYLPTSTIPFWPALAWWRFGALEGTEAAPYFASWYWHLLQQEQMPWPELYPLYWRAGELWFRLLYTSVPLAFGWALLRRLRGPRPADEAASRRSLLAWLALAVFLSALPRADAFHVLSVHPMVALLLFALASSGAAPRRQAWRLRLAAAAVALVLLLCAGLTWRYRSFLTYPVRLERAEVWVDPADAWIEPLVENVARIVRPNQRMFVYGHEAQFYFLTGRYYPWPFSQLYPGQEGEDGGKELSFRLAFVPPRLVLKGVQRWPGVPDLAESVPDLDHYIVWHFKADENFFVEHPVPGGMTPPPWVISVLEPFDPGI
jgi:hypothetical protein